MKSNLIEDLGIEEDYLRRKSLEKYSYPQQILCKPKNIIKYNIFFKKFSNNTK